MKSTYSIYEAKAKLSEVIRLVKQGRRITITDRGREVARVVPIEPDRGFPERLAELEAAGVVTEEASLRPREIRPVARRPGALRDFLDSRD